MPLTLVTKDLQLLPERILFGYLNRVSLAVGNCHTRSRRTSCSLYTSQFRLLYTLSGKGIKVPLPELEKFYLPFWQRFEALPKWDITINPA